MADLPPMPSPIASIESGPHYTEPVYDEDSMRAYATAARTPLLAENDLLRKAHTIDAQQIDRLLTQRAELLALLERIRRAGRLSVSLLAEVNAALSRHAAGDGCQIDSGKEKQG